MSIRVRELADPLSEQSMAAVAMSAVNVAPSAAGLIFGQELERYCAGQTLGRSFLIAGHRGAGKTTMVAHEIDRVQHLSRSGGDRFLLRPLPVFLHGPTLFEASGAAPPVAESAAKPPAATALAAAAAALTAAAAALAGGGPDPAAGAKPSPTGAAAPVPANAPEASRASASAAAQPSRAEALAEQTRIALIHVILGLHRAAIREFVRAYRVRVLDPKEERLWPDPASARRRPSGREAELAELAAQFEIEVMEDPPASRLRDFWAQAGLLEAGVLFALPPRPDQGLRELVALNGMCNAHQRIANEIHAKSHSSQGASNEATRTSGIDAKGAEIAKAVSSVLAGTAVATGGVVALGSAWATGLGLVTAIAAATFFKSSSTGSEKRERQVDFVSIPDLSHKTLDRVLPAWIRRLREAGLAPVLVIDELDKVPALAEKLKDMINFLKKLVAENVFTCFLTDRGYLEHLRVTGRGSAYGLAYSYFSHPLLVAFRPQDLDRHLDALLVADAPRASPGAGPSSAPTRDVDALALRVLKWVLKHRSRLHALELVREVAALRSAGDAIAVRAETILSDYTYRIDVTLQVAIELQMKAPEIVGWQRQRPDMQQVLLDAMYFLSREWIGDCETVMLGSEGQAALKDHLCKRMNLDEVVSKPAAGAAAAALELISPQDFTLLLDAVAGIAAFLCETNDRDIVVRKWNDAVDALGGDAETERLPAEVVDALLLGDKSLLRSVPTGSTESFRWRYWPSGMERAGNGANAAANKLAVEDALRAEARIAAFGAALELELGSDPAAGGEPENAFQLLAERLRILPTTPAWAHVKTAIANLQLARHGQANRTSLTSDCRAVLDFDAMLTANAALVASALGFGALLGSLLPEAEPAEALRRGLDVLSSGLRFAAADNRASVARLAALHKQLPDEPHALAVGLLPAATAALPPGGSDLKALLESARVAGAALAADAQVRRESVIEAGWRGLLARATRAHRAKEFDPANLAELECAIGGFGPAAFIGLDLQTLTLGQWSSVLMRTLRGAASSNAGPSPAPSWLAVFALGRLGAASLTRAAQDELQTRMVRLWPRYSALQAPAPTPVQAPSPAAAAAATPASAGSAPDWLFRDAEGSSRRLGVLVSRSRESVADRWATPPADGVLLVLSEAEWAASQDLTEDLLAQVSLIAVEEPTIDAALPAAAAALPHKLGRSDLCVGWVYARPQPNTATPMVIDPQKPDDVMALMQAAPAPSPLRK